MYGHLPVLIPTVESLPTIFLGNALEAVFH